MRLKAVRSTLMLAKPTLGALVPIERTPDQERTAFAPWRRLYKTARWRDLRLAVLPEPYRTRGTDVLDGIDRALTLARQARTLGAQLAAVRQADGLLAQIGRLTGAR